MIKASAVFLSQMLVIDFFVVIIKLHSELTTLGRTENYLRTALDHLSSELYFLILSELPNFENIISSRSLFLIIYTAI